MKNNDQILLESLYSKILLKEEDTTLEDGEISPEQKDLEDSEWYIENLLSDEIRGGHTYNNINYIYKAPFNLPTLRKAGKIYAEKTKEINLPDLEEAVSIVGGSAITVNLPELHHAEHLELDNVKMLELPKLITCGDIFTRAEEIHLPNLYMCGYIYAENAKKIFIMEHLKNKLERVPKDCDIIYPKFIKINETTQKYVRYANNIIKYYWHRRVIIDS
jgi:hypothetical protein